MRINEIWQKGHPTRHQVFRLLKNGLANIAEVHLLDKSDSRGVIEVSMFVHDLVDRFGKAGASDKLLSRLFYLDKKEQELGSFDLTLIKSRRQTYELFNRLFKTSLMNFRSFIPRGWISNGNTGDVSADSLKNHKIKFYILRDYNATADRSKEYYHITYANNKNSILQHGLQPRSNSRVGFHGFRDRVYLMTSDPKMEYDFVYHLMTGGYFGDRGKDTEIVIFRVELPVDVETYRDPEYNNGVYIEEPVSPNNLEIMYHGTLDKYGDMTG